MARLKPMKTQYDNAVSQAIYNTWRTQTEAAKAMGVKQASLSAWIRKGQVPIEKLGIFTKKTGVSPASVSKIYRTIEAIA